MNTPREPEAPASLREVQSFLTEMFRLPHPVTRDPDLVARAAVHVTGNDRLTPAEQVDVYRRQFWLRHDDLLAEDFPALRAVLGDDAWQAFLKAYLAAFPPSTPSLRDLGVNVPRFLEAWPGLPEDRAPLCRDVARYEIVFVEVFDGADPPPLDAARIAALTPSDWETATFVLSPLVRRMRLEHPAHLLRAAVRDDPAVDAGAWALEHPARATHLAVFRKDLRVHYEELSPDAFLMLDAIASGSTLLAACGRVAEGKSEDDAQALAASVGGWFRRWSSWGFIADIVVGPKP